MDTQNVLSDREMMNDDCKAKKILEGSMVLVDIDVNKRTLTFKVNGEEVYTHVKTSLTPEKIFSSCWRNSYVIQR